MIVFATDSFCFCFGFVLFWSGFFVVIALDFFCFVIVSDLFCFCFGLCFLGGPNPAPLRRGPSGHDRGPEPVVQHPDRERGRRKRRRCGKQLCFVTPAPFPDYYFLFSQISRVSKNFTRKRPFLWRRGVVVICFILCRRLLVVQVKEIKIGSIRMGLVNFSFVKPFLQFF